MYSGSSRTFFMPARYPLSFSLLLYPRSAWGPQPGAGAGQAQAGRSIA